MPVYKDVNGTWYVKLRYTDYNGKKRQKMKRGFALQRDAKEWESDFLTRYSGQPDMTFKTLCSLYMENLTVKDSSKHITNIRLNRWIIPFFGDMRISEITPAHIRQWHVTLKNAVSDKGKPLAEGYKGTLQANLTGVFNYAVRYHGLVSNPCSIVGNPFPSKSKHVDFWTKKDFDLFIDTFDKDDEYYTAFKVLYYTGMRIGELLALTAADIDFTKKTITVSKTLHRRKNRNIITSPKTATSNRVVTIPPFLCKLLEAHISRIYGHTDDALIFRHAANTYARILKIHAEQAGVKKIRVHDLRHSHASLLIDLDFPVTSVSERLGHNNAGTTLNIYSHLFAARRTEIAEKLELLE